MTISEMKELYQEGIKDSELINEAIATLESQFNLMSEEEIRTHSRTLVISYLALIYARDNLRRDKYVNRELLDEFIPYAKTKYGLTVKAVKSDNPDSFEKIFVSSTF